MCRQEDDLLGCEFLGGKARRGALSGVWAPGGKLDFAYRLVLDDGEVIAGQAATSASAPTSALMS